VFVLRIPPYDDRVRWVRSSEAKFALAACILMGAACRSAPLVAATAAETASSTAAASTATSEAFSTATLSPSPSPEPTLTPALPAIWIDLAYAERSAAQRLDLYTPSGAGPFPLIIYVHGGAWAVGEKYEPDMPGLVTLFNNNGYALASLNYRLSEEASFPAAIQDVKTAVRWLRANAQEYELDPDRFGTWGRSAGGNLVALLGTSCGVSALEGADLGNADQSSCVQAVVDWFGPINFLLMDTHFEGTTCPQVHSQGNSPESDYVGGPILKYPQLVRAANPVTYVSADDPPFLIQHGTKDCTVPYQQSQLLYDALLPAIGEANVTLTLLEGAEHGDPQFMSAANLALMLDFLDQYLK